MDNSQVVSKNKKTAADSADDADTGAVTLGLIKKIIYTKQKTVTGHTSLVF